MLTLHQNVQNRFRILLLKIFTVIIALFETPIAISLPIGFGVNQGDLKYDQLKSKNFKVYFDHRVPNESKMIINSLEQAKPIMEEWLGIERPSLLPIITSAVTSRPSFANPVTDVLEIQTLGQGTRDLFFHEYVHNTMYLHLKNFLGPAGSILHLPWMPAWFIEGLAESITVSLGSATSSSIERHHALMNQWPSFDKLHSLYGAGNFFLTGYALSGGFVSWILSKSQKPLPKFLQDFYDYTLPLYFPLSLNPFSRFMPFDQTLKESIGLSAKSAYESYKNEVTKFWEKRRSGIFLSGTEGKRILLSGFNHFRIREKSPILVFKGDNESYQEKKIRFDETTGWAREFESTQLLFLTNTLAQTIFGQRTLKFIPKIRRILIQTHTKTHLYNLSRIQTLRNRLRL